VRNSIKHHARKEVATHKGYPQHQVAYFQLTNNPLPDIFTLVKSNFLSFSLAAMGVAPALDEIEDGEAGFGVRPKGVAVDELLNREIFYTLIEAQFLIRRWRREYNQVRPHSSLGYRPPAPEPIEWLPGATGRETPGMNGFLT
jgi:transposase InsO family protein